MLYDKARGATRVKTRDTQRSRVYKADHALDKYGRLETVPEIERFVRKVWKSKRVQAAFRRATKWTPVVEDGRGRRRAGGGYTGITMPKWSRTKGVILHELAHTVMHREGYEDDPAHGWRFCRTYLLLVLYALGREAHDDLKAAFKANRIRFTEPRKRKPLSPERRAELAERLAKARAARTQT